ncbi:hypothetical protein VW040_01020 [Phaeobacter sp. JH85H1]
MLESHHSFEWWLSSLMSAVAAGDGPVSDLWVIPELDGLQSGSVSVI